MSDCKVAVYTVRRRMMTLYSTDGEPHETVIPNAREYAVVFTTLPSSIYSYPIYPRKCGLLSTALCKHCFGQNCEIYVPRKIDSFSWHWRKADWFAGIPSISCKYTATCCCKRELNRKSLNLSQSVLRFSNVSYGFYILCISLFTDTFWQFILIFLRNVFVALLIRMLDER